MNYKSSMKPWARKFLNFLYLLEPNALFKFRDLGSQYILRDALDA